MALAYSVRFSAVQTGRRRVRRGAAIQLVLQPGNEPVVGRLVGPPRARWRHHARAHLADDAFPDVRVRGDAHHIEVVERQLARRFLTGGFRGLAMAPDAVAIEEGALRRNLGRTRR